MQSTMSSFRRALPVLRMGARATRTAGLAIGIGYSSYCSGVHDALSDPEGTTEKLMRQVLEQHAKNTSGRTPGAPTLLPADKRDSILVSRLGDELVMAAQAALAAEADGLSVERACGGRRAAREAEESPTGIQPQVAFPGHDNDTINAFVTDQLPDRLPPSRAHQLWSASQSVYLSSSAMSLPIICSTTTRPTAGCRLASRSFSLWCLQPSTRRVCFAGDRDRVVARLLNLTVEAPAGREHEHEADALGLQMVVRACRNPREAIKAHEVLASMSRRRAVRLTRSRWSACIRQRSSASRR